LGASFVFAVSTKTRYDRAVELYTPLSAEEVARLDRGEGYADLTYYFVDKPDPDEATEDAIWVMIEMPDAEALPFEIDSPPELGYREFALPGPVATRFPVRRAPHVRRS
jgi:hypothetical protein